MKLRNTIILAIIISIIAAYVFLYEKKQYRTEEWLLRQQMVLPDYKANQIDKIEFKRDVGSIILEKGEDGSWRMLEPLQLRADKAAIAEIISEFEFLGKIGTLKKDAIPNFNLGNYGLDKPQVVVTLWRKKGTFSQGEEDAVSKFTVNVGDKISAGEADVYIRVDGQEDVFVVEERLLRKVNKDINDLRNKWAFEFDEDAIQRVKIINTSGEEIVCARQDQLWWLTQPVSDRADSGIIGGILNELKNLEIAKTDFVSDLKEDMAKCGLDKPRVTVSIGQQDDVQTLLLGGSKDNKVYAKREDESAIFFVHDVVVRDFDLEPNDLRDRQLLRFDSIGTYGIEKIDLEYSDVALTMEKTKQYDWLIKSPIEILADRDTVREFVEKIKDIQIQEYVDDSGKGLAEFGLEKPAVEISVFRKIGEGETVKFMVGNTDENGGLCYVMRAGEDAVYSVPTEDFYDVATGRLIAFRDKIALEFNKDKATEIVIERSGNTFTCRKETGLIEKWFLVDPVRTEADSEAINQVVWNLSFLKVDKFVTLKADDIKEYGLDSPVIKVSITYEDSGSEEGGDVTIAGSEDTIVKPAEMATKTLLVGSKIEPQKDKSSYFAKFSDEDMIFQVGWPDIRDYSVELATKKLFDFDISQSKNVKVKAPGKELVFQRNEVNKWRMTQPEDKLVEGNLVDRILASVAALRAESVVQYSSENLSEFELDNPRFAVTVESNEGENSLLIGKKTNREYFVMNKPLNFIYLVRKDKIEDIMNEIGQDGAEGQ